MGIGRRYSGPSVRSGISSSSTSSSSTPASTPKKRKTAAPNPDVSNYKLIQAEEIGNFLLIKIHYPDCTNFEGNKILLYRNIKLIDLVNQKLIDPHFFEDSKFISPIARFFPTDEGWQMAKKLIAALTVPS